MTTWHLPRRALQQLPISKRSDTTATFHQNVAYDAKKGNIGKDHALKAIKYSGLRVMIANLVVIEFFDIMKDGVGTCFCRRSIYFVLHINADRIVALLN